jgi:flagellar motor switch protein FliN/FliY
MDDSTPEAEATAGEAPAVAVADTETSSTMPVPAAAAASGIPSFAEHLLKIRVPVRVTLAAQRKSVQDIVDLGPGAIVKFAKTCDEPLELCVGDCLFATGEVIKVGDKFGVRIGTRK